MNGDVSAMLEKVEEALSINFRPGEFSDESTYEDLCDAVRVRFLTAKAHVSFTSIAFWRLRRGCVNLFGTRKQDVTPSAATDLIIPSRGRYRAWRQLEEASGLRLPGLEFSSLMSYLMFPSAALGSIVATSALAPEAWRAWAGGALVIVTSLFLTPVVAAALLFLFRPLANALPTNCSNFGNLAKTVAGLNYGNLVQEFGPARESETMEALRHVLGDMIDFAPELLLQENPRLVDLAEANDGFRATV